MNSTTVDVDADAEKKLISRTTIVLSKLPLIEIKSVLAPSLLEITRTGKDGGQ